MVTELPDRAFRFSSFTRSESSVLTYLSRSSPLRVILISQRRSRLLASSLLSQLAPHSFDLRLHQNLFVILTEYPGENFKRVFAMSAASIFSKEGFEKDGNYDCACWRPFKASANNTALLDQIFCAIKSSVKSSSHLYRAVEQ